MELTINNKSENLNKHILLLIISLTLFSGLYFNSYQNEKKYIPTISLENKKVMFNSTDTIYPLQ